MNKKMILIAGASIIILVLILVAVISAGKKKTGQERVLYASAQDGYAFTYPTDWKLKDSGAANAGFDANQLVPSKQKNCPQNGSDGSQPCVDSILFGVVESSAAANIKSLDDIKKITAEKFGWPDQVTYNNFKKIAVSGKTAYAFSITNATLKQDSNFVWIALNDSKILSLTAAYLDGDQEKTFNGIISTLKFTKK